MEGLIRKITVGRDPKNAMVYFVGMKAGRGDSHVTAIVFDLEWLHVHGKERYYVYLQQEDMSQVVWKTVADMPCIIEYDLNF